MTRPVLVVALLVGLLTGCSGTSTPVSTASSTAVHSLPGVSPTVTPPARLPDAAASSRSPVRKAPRPTPPTLAVLPTEPNVPGYSRTQFGPAWTDNNTTIDGHNGCDTRNDVLREQLTGVTSGRACTTRSKYQIVLAGVLADPYTGRLIPFSRAKPSAVQIDHIVPLHYAWNMGAWRWSAAERVNFANDTVTELLAVDGPQNESKGDDGPAGYMPPNASYRCIYAQRFTDVLRIYKLSITAADLAAVGRCGQ